jgi:LmbE family N-acetylglucosaminyl deacetylase
MLSLTLDRPRRHRLEVLCLGAHCDDIEIGCGATLMRLADERPIAVTWVILSSTSARAAETRRSAGLFLRRARARHVQLEAFRDGFLPAQWKEVKECFEGLKRLRRPDVIFTHERDDRHQDHRVVCELTWNTFRDHLILEYEIPKYDGGIGQPNLYVPVTTAVAERKSQYLLSAYRSQATNSWFTPETFRGLMRLRGIESNAEQGYAEAFHSRKALI